MGVWISGWTLAKKATLQTETRLPETTVKHLRSLSLKACLELWDEIEAKGRKEGKLTQYIRMLCQADLYYLLVRGCKREDLVHPWFFARTREVEANPDGHLDLWAREHGKDLADDTPMLTANRGWTTHGELQVGDQVFAPSGKAVRVLALSERYTESKCYRVTFNDGAQIVAGAGHLWKLRVKHKHRIANSESRLVSFSEEVVTTEHLSGDYRCDVSVGQALEYPEASLPVDPYILGAWLGDGHSTSAVVTMLWEDAQPLLRRLEANGHKWKAEKTNSRALTYRIDGRDGATCLRGHPRTPENLYRHACLACKNQHQRKKLFGDEMDPIVKDSLGLRLRRMGVLPNKHIPQEYMTASIEQRMQLLRGLMDTDGTCNDRGTADFVNTNERLAWQVCDLAYGLGLRPRFAQYDKTLHGEPYPVWRVTFQAHKDRNPFALKRKADRAIDKYLHRDTRLVDRIEQIDSVPTRCIQVEGGMYLAGRELIPTHNSSIITFGLSIWNILNDPEVTIGAFSHSRPIAKAFLRLIMRELETNVTLQTAFPDILWSDIRQAPKWSEDDGIIVKRKSNPNEATVEAWGLVDGQPVSKHFSVLLYDDIVVQASVTTPEMIQKTMTRLEESYSLGKIGGARRFCGTRYHFNDAYRTIIDRGTAIPREYPGRKGGTEEGESVYWSEQTHLDKRRDMGPYTYACQILLNPKADALQGFRREWIRKYKKINPAQLNWYLLADPASSKKKGSDYTAMWAVGLGRDGNYYCVPEVRDRLNLKERGDRLFDLHRKYKPKQVRYEKYGLMSDIEHYQSRMEQENYRFQITEVGGVTSKIDRIKRLIPLFEAGRIWIPESLHVTDWQKNTVDLVHAFVEEEMYPFPVGLHDDMLDSLARICEPELTLAWPKEEKAPALPPRRNFPQAVGWMA